VTIWIPGGPDANELLMPSPLALVIAAAPTSRSRSRMPSPDSLDLSGAWHEPTAPTARVRPDRLAASLLTASLPRSPTAMAARVAGPGPG